MLFTLDRRSVENRSSRPFLGLVAVWLLAPGALAIQARAQGPAAEQAGPAETAAADFAEHVRPLLAAHCWGCHGDPKREGSLDLRTLAGMLRGGDSGAAIEPGKAAESPLYQRVAAGEMPPKDKPRLSEREIAALARWIDAGAAVPPADMGENRFSAAAIEASADFWSFRTPRQPDLPLETPLSAEPLPPNAGAAAPHLLAWYKADDLRLADREPVVRWPDASGHGRDLAPTAGVSRGTGQPPKFAASSSLGGLPAVRFDAASGLAAPASAPLPLTGDAPFTLVVVANLRPAFGGPTANVIGFGQPAPGANPGRPLAALLELDHSLPAGPRWSLAGGFGHNASTPAGSLAPVYDRSVVLAIRKSPGAMRATTEFFANGVPATQLAGGGTIEGSDLAPDLRSRDDFSLILGHAIGEVGGMQGDLAEAAVYGAALDDATLRGIEAGLAAKYTLSVPAAWRGEGAPASDPFWAEHAARVKNPIDALVLDELRRQGLRPAPPADRQTLVRRAYFDLLGLPPSPEKTAQFVNDPAADAYARLIDELLASPQYGERWGRHWLDAARYADTGGYETDIYYRHAWRYRDYVIKSFNDDKPYDQFVQEQIAADEIWPDNLALGGSYEMPPEKTRHLEARIGTGFYTLGPQIHESNMDGKKLDYERLTDWVDSTGAVFMGLTLGCARCHDHKFDPLSQRDYFSLQAAFAGSKEVEIPLMNGMEVADYKQFYPRILQVDEARRRYKLFEKRVAGRGLSPAETAERQQLLEAIAQAVLALPERAGSSPGEAWDGLMEIASAAVLDHERAELVPAVHVLHRGDLDRSREAVSAAVPQVLAHATRREPALPGPFGSRKELALWLTQPDHPLTARVMVNRVWQWHFGRGLTTTPNDFGKMGAAPSHPALLDWLAVEFVRRGWSVKALHRLIMLSSTYRQSSQFGDERNLLADADNRYLWRMNRRRLEAEALWDAMHAVAGTLNLKMGGRPVIPPISPDEIASMRDPWQWVVTADPQEHDRRGVYILVRRNFRFPMFEVFDAPVNAVSCPARDVTTVAPQALWFLNNETSLRQAQALAARLVRERGDDRSAWVEGAWQWAMQRAPTEHERAEAIALLDQLASAASGAAGETGPRLLEPAPSELAALSAPRAASLAAFCLAMFNLNEFTYID